MKEVIGYEGNTPIFVDRGPATGIAAPMTTGFAIEQVRKPGKGGNPRKRKTLSARVKYWRAIESEYPKQQHNLALG